MRLVRDDIYARVKVLPIELAATDTRSCTTRARVGMFRMLDRGGH